MFEWKVILALISYFTLCLGSLRNSSELTSHCYHFPAKDFGKPNNVKQTYGSSPYVVLKTGDTAIDFTLNTVEGKSVTLSELLKKTPVIMIWGHYSCPAWQGYKSDTMFLQSSHDEEYKLVDLVKNKITVLHMIGPEPHPIWPYANFDSGSLKMNYWSTIQQPQTYEERISVSVEKVKDYLHPNVILLPDKLDGKMGKYNNPVWCSYANGARSAIFIGKDGVVITAQDWFNRETLTKVIRDNVDI